MDRQGRPLSSSCLLALVAAVALGACGPGGSDPAQRAGSTASGALALTALDSYGVPPGTGGTYRPSYVTNVTGAGAYPNLAPGSYTSLTGAKGDCVTDDTAAFRSSIAAAAARRQPLVVPPPTGAPCGSGTNHPNERAYRITGTLTVTTSIVGQNYPLIQMDGATGDSAFVMLRLSGRGIWIAGLHLDGGYDPTGGSIPPPLPGGSVPAQWSAGIDVNGSRNVTIQGNLIENTLGDDIYVGDNGTSGSSGQAQNVLVDGNTLDNPFRCNVALINASGVVVTNNIMRKKNSFVFGIDYEPNQGDVGVSNTEVAYNDVVAPTATDARLGDNSNLQFAAASCSYKGGTNNYLHHNYGDFDKTSDANNRGGYRTDTWGRTVDSTKRGLWWSSDLYSCPKTWKILVWSNLPGSSPPSP